MTALLDVYPKTVKENLEFRHELLTACEKDARFAQEMKELCARDILFWIDCFCFTKDPRKAGAILPFICYEAYQRNFIKEVERSINTGEDILIEKSRDMGASWMVLYVYMHKWLFEKGSDFRVGSRKEEFVDRRGDIDTLFEKIRFNLSKQPGFLLPPYFSITEDMPLMRIINPENENAIIGESANEDFGSGGRRKSVLLDEFSKWESNIADAAWTATADVTRSRIVVSTPKGSANKFARLAKGTKEKIKVLTLHWTLHPEKSAGSYYISGGIRIDIDLSKDNQAAFKLWKQGIRVRSPWYDAEDARREEADLAQEVDIDYHRSGSMFFSAKGLSSQKPWEFYTRHHPTAPIPYGKYIRGMLLEVDNKIEFRETPDGYISLFELPKEGYQYAIGGDSAEGLTKGDEAYAVARCKITRNLVASFRGHITPEDFAKKLQLLAWYFNEADVAPENNNHGYTTARELESMSHCKLYYTRKEEMKDGVKMVTPKRGFTTDLRTRPELLNQMAHEIDKAACELRDATLIGQCSTFIRNGDKGGRPEADGEFLDDGVIACGIAGYVIQEIPFKAAIKKINAAQREAVEKRVKMRNGGFGFGE